MQLNILANHPMFKNLACTGYWGSGYSEDELHTWSMMLLRHYCIEGRRDMLSDKYGFSYKPGHILDGDFREGLARWTCKGDVSASKVKGFYLASQGRWCSSDGASDTFAVLNGKADGPSSLTQVAKGLVPGKAYCLKFLCFDAGAFGAAKLNCRKYGVEAKLENVSIMDNLSWERVDMRLNGKPGKANFSPVNLRQIVFVAKAPEATITLENSGAKPGENLGVSMVSLNPFFLGD